jgi:hypothetical protein
MTSNNLLGATSSLRSSVTSLKKKMTHLRSNLEYLGTEIDTLDTKLDKLVTESEIYRAKLDREMGREVRRLEKELELLRKQISSSPELAPSPEEDLRIASTIAIIECLLRVICGPTGDDFRLISYAFIFPAVIERVVKGTEDAYFLEEIPISADVIIRRGQEYIAWIRSECDTHLTDPQAWKVFSPQISDWWRNDALPLLYGSRDENWDIDEPLSNLEMISWRDDVAERPFQFPSVFDAYDVYRRHKDEIYKSSGIQDFEMKTFSHEAN